MEGENSSSGGRLVLTYTMGSTSFHLGRIEEWTQSTSYINLSDVGFI
jgi:hypothetical protein